MRALAASLAIALALAAAGLTLVTAQVPTYQVKYVAGPLPSDPASWPTPMEVPLASQLLVYPIPAAPTERVLRVSALHNGSHVGFLLTWQDPTNDTPGPGALDAFPDAVAIQFPVSRAQLPHICMGTVDNPVNIVYWRAGQGAEELVAGAGYGLSPEQREALGLQGTPTSPVEALPVVPDVVRAAWRNGTWQVVVIRPAAPAHPLMATLAQDFNAAFAVWDGSRGERGGLKAVSGWISFRLERPTAAATPTEAAGTPTATVVRVAEATPAWAWAVIGLLVALAALLAGIAAGRR